MVMKNKLKSIISIVLLVLMIAVSLTACNVQKADEIGLAPSAKELMQKYVDNAKSKYRYADKTFDVTKLVKEWLTDSKESTNLITVDLDVPFEFDSKSGGMNGKLTVSANASLLNIGKKSNDRLGNHKLLKVKCDYKYSFGGSIFPTIISFDGNVVCYIAVSEDGDTIRGYYKLNDFDKNWYTFKFTEVNNAFKLFKDFEEKSQKDLDEAKTKILEDDNTNEETKKYAKNIETDYSKITEKLVDHYYDLLVEKAEMVNPSANIDELNVKNAYEVKSDINILDDFMIDFINSYVPDAQKEDFKKIGLEQLKDKLILNTTIYFVNGEKSPVNFDGYSVVKEVTDLKDFVVDYTYDDIKFKLSFNKGQFDSVMKNDSESDNISNEIIDNAKTVIEYKLSDVAGYSSF